MKTIDFTKMVASGNDFVVIKTTAYLLSPIYLRSFAKKICDRHYGIGADGLLMIEKSRKADFKMRIINPDGTEAEMCGNGARCAALYAKLNRIAGKKMEFETLAGIIKAEISGDKVRLKMSDPKNIKLDISLTIDGRNYIVNFVDTGVPHSILFTDKLSSCDVGNLGRKIRYHNIFAPKGANVNFIEPQKRNTISVRTYERGVEGETLACGTGSTAAAIIASAIMNFRSPVICLTKSGEALKIYFKKTGINFKDVYLEGSAKEVFQGVVPL